MKWHFARISKVQVACAHHRFLFCIFGAKAIIDLLLWTCKFIELKTVQFLWYKSIDRSPFRFRRRQLYSWREAVGRRHTNFGIVLVSWCRSNNQTNGMKYVVSDETLFLLMVFFWMSKWLFSPRFQIKPDWIPTKKINALHVSSRFLRIWIKVGNEKKKHERTWTVVHSRLNFSILHLLLTLGQPDADWAHTKFRRHILPKWMKWPLFSNFLPKMSSMMTKNSSWVDKKGCTWINYDFGCLKRKRKVLKS